MSGASFLPPIRIDRNLLKSPERRLFRTPLVVSACPAMHQGLSQKLPHVVSACSVMHQGQSVKFDSMGAKINVKHIAGVSQYSPNIFRKNLGDNCRSLPSLISVRATHSPHDNDLMREFGKHSKVMNGKDRVAIDGGIGSILYDVDGNAYVDFNCNHSFGHTDPDTRSSIMDALGTVIDHKNLKGEVSKQLIARSFAHQVFYTNSQTEAMQLGIAIIGVYQQWLHPLRPGEVVSAVEIIVFIDTFHGGTMDSISPLDHQGKPFAHWGPSGFTFLNYGDIETALTLLKQRRIAALFVEPFQGKDCTNLATKEFLQALRAACNDAGCLLVFDETQCGFGLTGNIWAHQTYGIFPDMMVVGDSLADGQPFGAVLVNDRVGKSITRGELVISPVSLVAVLDMVNKFSKPFFSGIVKKKAEDFKLLLIKKLGGNSHVKEIRPNGLAIGIEFDVSALPLVEACRKSGLLISTVGTPNAILLRPPLIISKADMNKGAEILLQSMPALDEDI